MNVWKRIISSSVIYLGVRFSFGILSNFIFYYIFSPTILLLIKRAELFLRLPVILNFGASKYLATQGIKDELDKSLISNFLILGLAAIISAIAGSFIGFKSLKKITLNFIRNLVAIMILLIAFLLLLGIL